MDVRKNRTNLEYTKKEIFVDGNKTICNLTFIIKLNNPPFSLLGLTYNDIIKICKVPELVSYGPFPSPEYVEFQTTAQASLNEGDEFDSTFGERLALTRAQAKAYMVAQIFYAYVANHFDEKAATASDLMNNSYNVWRKCLTHAQKLEDNKYKK